MTRRSKIAWTAEMVLERIKARHDSGLAINSADVDSQDEPLAGAARRLFGSWGKAVTAAGYDYEAVKKEARNRPRNPPGTWDAQQVIKKIKERHVQGLPMNAHSVQVDDSKLYSAAVTHLDSWGKAVEAAGIDYLEHRKTIEWDKDKLAEKIRSLHEVGADLSDRNVNLLNGSLYGAAATYHGSWPAAVEAAGVEYQEVSRTEKWSKEKLRALALGMMELGLEVNTTTLPVAMRDYYSSIDELLADVGLATPKRQPTPNSVAQYREQAGLSQRQLGPKIGRSHTWIRYLEMGRVEPTVGEALRLARELNASVEHLFTVGKDENPV